MTISVGLQKAILTLVDSSFRLESLSLPAGMVTEILQPLEVVAFRLVMPPSRPLVIGMLGCTGTGKSTIFNSLIGEDCSEISWRAHNTRGPIVRAPMSFLGELDRVETSQHLRFFPRWKRRIHQDRPAQVSGNLDTVELCLTNDDSWRTVILIDLPDINTTLSHEENHIAESLQAWLDVCVFVMDEETLFHKEYNRSVAHAREWGQQTVAVLNHRGRDRYVQDDPDIDAVRTYFAVATLHALPVIESGDRFTEQPGFLALKADLLKRSGAAPVEPLVTHATRPARQILERIDQRREQLDQLDRVFQEALARQPRKQQPVSLKTIMHDDVLHVLDNLGFKRLSLQNLLSFGKRMTTSTSWLRNIQLSFGSKRIRQLDHLLQFDEDKLYEVVAARVNDQLEAIRAEVSRQEQFDELVELAPDIWRYTLQPTEALKPRLRDMLTELETKTREVLEADTVKNAIRQDPLMAFSAFVILVLDMIVIPGMGYVALVPSVMKYLPLGPFERVKQSFQKQVDEIVHTQVSTVRNSIDEAREQLVLSADEPLYLALKQVADHDA